MLFSVLSSPSLQVANTSPKAVQNLKLALSANSELYSLQHRVHNMPALLPGLQYTFKVRALCLAPESGCCGDVRISVVKIGVSRPLISATVTLPVSEVDDE